MEEEKWTMDNEWTTTAIKQYADIFERLSLTELSVEENGKKLTLKKLPPKPNPMLPPGPGMPYPAPGSTPIERQTASPEEKAEAANDGEEGSLHTVKAPLLGMLHLSPAPDKAPFLKAGDRVKKGDTLCVIEAMKMMNDISAPFDGVVEKICAKEGDIVEYGQTLFLLS